MELKCLEMTQEDIPLIVDYWTNAPDDYLKNMGVDLYKKPNAEMLTSMLNHQLKKPLAEKKSYATVWFLDNTPMGHCNVNPIRYGESAAMHIHIWEAKNRNRGYGGLLAKKSIKMFFDNLNLKFLYSEPYSMNSAPINTLEKTGFSFVKHYVTIPGEINFEQTVSRYELHLKNFKPN